MSDIAISVQNLSKKYRIGSGPRNDTLRDALSSSVRRLAGKGIAGDSARREDEIWALKDVSFEVGPGEVVGIIGRNGAGKSTLLKILSRITEPTSGRVEIRGRVGSLLEVGTGFHPELTGRENIFLNGAILGMRRYEIEKKFDEIVAFAEIEKFLDTPVKRYSSGMYVRLAFAVAAHLNPEILLVDEVLAVGDAAFQKKCLGRMGELAHVGRTVMFVSHNMPAIRTLCSSAIRVAGGAIVARGSTDGLIDDYLADTRAAKGSSYQDLYPVQSSQYAVSLTQVTCQLVPGLSGGSNLEIGIGVVTGDFDGQIGVGVLFRSSSGVLVSQLDPSMTGYFAKTGRHSDYRFLLQAEHIERFFNGGEYHLQVWLSRPGFEPIIVVEDAASIEIPATDLYGQGIPFSARTRGFVPLSMEFRVERSGANSPEKVP